MDQPCVGDHRRRPRLDDGPHAEVQKVRRRRTSRPVGVAASCAVGGLNCADSRRRLRSNHCQIGETMTSSTGIAKMFFEACETGKGWEGCKAYCKTDATFSA